MTRILHNYIHFMIKVGSAVQGFDFEVHLKQNNSSSLYF